MHHVNYFWVNLGTAYIGQCISVTDITHLNRLCVTIHVLLCILKCFGCIWSFSFFGRPLRRFYKSMYIIAFLFLTSLLFYLKGYSETLKLCYFKYNGCDTCFCPFTLIKNIKYRFWSETERKLFSKYLQQISLYCAFERTLP